MKNNSDKNKIIEAVSSEKYKYGFSTDLKSERPDKGINEEIIKYISKKNSEPKWLLDWRLKAFSYWKKEFERSYMNKQREHYPLYDPKQTAKVLQHLLD